MIFFFFKYKNFKFPLIFFYNYIMKEIIHIHIGSSGIRIGSELWKLYELENPHSPVIFEEVKDHWQPRAILADLDYMTINQYKN